MRAVGSEFEAFVDHVRPRLARAFVAAYGPDRGQEALAEAMAYAWEHSHRMLSMANPGGYLFRVGQSRTRRRRQPVLFPPPVADRTPGVEPTLPAALAALPERQRVCCVLAHGYGWTHVEVAELLGLSKSSVQNHVDRGMARLRAAIGEVLDA